MSKEERLSDYSVISVKELLANLKSFNTGSDKPVVFWCDMPKHLALPQYSDLNDLWAFSELINRKHNLVAVNHESGFPKLGITPIIDDSGEVQMTVPEYKDKPWLNDIRIKHDEDRDIITKLYITCLDYISDGSEKKIQDSINYIRMVSENLNIPVCLMFYNKDKERVLSFADLSGFDQYLCVDDDSTLLNKDGN